MALFRVVFRVVFRLMGGEDALVRGSIPTFRLDRDFGFTGEARRRFLVQL